MKIEFEGEWGKYNEVKYEPINPTDDGHRSVVIDLELESEVYHIGWTLVRLDKKQNKVTARPDKEYLITVQHIATNKFTVLHIKPSEVYIIDDVKMVADKTASGILHFTKDIKFEVEIKSK